MSSSRHAPSHRSSPSRPTQKWPDVSGGEAKKPDNGLPLQNRAIDTASGLWSVIVERGGLDLARYDAPLLEELANALHLPTDGFATALEREQIPIETLLKQMLRIVQPYAGMTRDIMALFARASARRSNENLRMRFEFADSVKDFEFDLLNFREWESRWQRVIRAVEVSELNILDAYELRHAFVEEGTTYRLESGRWFNLAPPDERVAGWLNSTARGESNLVELPTPPPSSSVYCSEECGRI